MARIWRVGTAVLPAMVSVASVPWRRWRDRRCNHPAGAYFSGVALTTTLPTEAHRAVQDAVRADAQDRIAPQGCGLGQEPPGPEDRAAWAGGLGRSAVRDGDSPGDDVARTEDKLGRHASDTAHIRFDSGRWPGSGCRHRSQPAVPALQPPA